ncbi:unnamed protein product [Scytosiphon promiscuus]
MAPTDRNALVALFNSTGGATWYRNENWNTDKDLSLWHGVEVLEGDVVNLDLSDNNLQGRIPPELGKLGALKKLDLRGNKLKGVIPAELGNLTAVETLDLGNNKLSRSIPKELGALTQLRKLFLCNNKLRGAIPPELGNLTVLQQLELWGNQLSGFIPPELGKLAALEVLYLAGNRLRGRIPWQLETLTALRMLDLGVNGLTGPIPPELGRLPALEVLNLRSNQLSGPIPGALGALAKLSTLDLSHNPLTGPIAPELGNLRELKSLVLFSNQLTGPIPEKLGDLAGLRQLLLFGNQLEGSIPPQLGNLAALQDLQLSTNELSEIPSEVLELCRGNLIHTGWNDNPWSRPPSTVLESGYETALGWWEDLKRFGAGKSNKLKLVLVGLAEAGKTTIVRRLTGEPVPKPADRTVGIEITPDWKPCGSVPLQVSIWDFAGQADYYSSHQLFLTKGALYLLVVDLRAFSKEMLESGVDNFTDPHGRIYWWLEMLYMRVPGAAIALVGTHVDLMEREDALKAGKDLHTVVSNFILHKVENASRKESTRGMGSETTAAMEEIDRSVHGQLTRRGSSTLRSGSERMISTPLVLHDRVFKVSLTHATTSELGQWISKAAYGQECPRGFNFPAVDQTVSKAWIVAYEAMDALKEEAPFVLWSKAVEEYGQSMNESLFDTTDTVDAGKILLRAMHHREAEGSVLLSLADTTAPVASDMLHLDPSWLIELVRRLVDHNIVDKKQEGTLEEGLRAYAKDQCLQARPLVAMQRVYGKSGHLDKAYLRFLWMHRKMDPPKTPVVMTDSEFDAIVLMMTTLLVMYQCPGADHLVVPARLQKYGDQSILNSGNMEESVLKVKCSFGQKYPPPGIVGRFLAWLTDRIATYRHCWLHGAFFSYNYESGQCKVFVYESEYEEPHVDDTESKFAGLTLGIEGSPDHAPKVLKELMVRLEELLSDSAYGYPGLADLMYFGEEETTPSTSLRDLRALLDNVGDIKEAVHRIEAAASRLEKTAKMLGGVVNRLREQPLLAASDEASEYPRLVLVRPEQDTKEVEKSEPHERIQRSGWDRWIRALKDFKRLPGVGVHDKFRMHFLCEHDLSVVPCGPGGRGYPIRHLRDWAKQCLPLMQASFLVSLWMLRVGVGVMSNVDLPLNGVLEAFVQATGAEVLNSMSGVPDTISSDSLPAFGAGAPEADVKKFKLLRGKAYEALCAFMRDVESLHPPRSGCLPFGCLGPSDIFDWRTSMVQVKNPRTGRHAWVLKTNKKAYLRDEGAARAPIS